MLYPWWCQSTYLVLVSRFKFIQGFSLFHLPPQDTGAMWVRSFPWTLSQVDLLPASFLSALFPRGWACSPSLPGFGQIPSLTWPAHGTAALSTPYFWGLIPALCPFVSQKLGIELGWIFPTLNGVDLRLLPLFPFPPLLQFCSLYAFRLLHWAVFPIAWWDQCLSSKEGYQWRQDWEYGGLK